MSPPAPLHADLIRDGQVRRIVPATGDMRVPGVVFTSDALLPAAREDASLAQVANVATLPGIVEASYAMPDMHWGYGFPIGGVAATDVEADGVVSPGGVGFDISCGVRLLAAPFDRAGLGGRLATVMDALAVRVPTGLGPGATWRLDDRADLERVLRGGAEHVVASGHGDDRDLERCEDHGRLEGADPSTIGNRAVERGRAQLGSLGSGNHFLEVQYVESVLDVTAADAFGITKSQICVMLHTGSRGLGHQVCSDQVRRMRDAMARYGIRVPDAQLASVPVDSPEGRTYLAAHAAAANFGLANRQLLTEAARDGFAAATGQRHLDVVYDVSHNLAKLEDHVVDGHSRRLCVHRKGATRAFPPGAAELPDDLRPVGQPVLLPGSMGTASYVLAGAAGGGAFHSAAHGAGRRMSRKQAKRECAVGTRLRDALAAEGIEVRAGALRDLPEEAPAAYKDVEEVVRVCELAGLARPVARLRPLGVVKG